MKKTRSRQSQLRVPPSLTQINAKSPPSVNRRQQLLSSKPVAEEQNNMGVEEKRRQTVSPVESEKSKRIGEVAGGTAAECAAICCCCPCGVMNLLILAVYKLPAGLCRKMWRRRNLRLKKKRNALLQQRPSAGPPTCSCDEGNVQMIERGGKNGVDLDDEMWARFYGAGFWRSSSQREA